MSTSACPPLSRLAGPLLALALFGAVALAVALRLVALSSELWFDEIWSWELARGAASPWAIFLDLHHDNNHKLNTLYLYCCPDGASWARYRAHSLLAGVGGVALAFVVARPWGRAEASFAALLLATNYWLVLCSAEARGYSLAVALALLAFGALRRWLVEGERWALVAFWFAVVFGFLAHLTFLHCYLALFLWSMRHFGRRSSGTWEQLVALVKCHAIPGTFVALLYVVDVRRMELGGGPPVPVGEVLARLIGLGLGGPAGGLAALPWLLLAGAVVGYGLARMARAGDGAWVFFAVAVLGAPAVFLIKRPPFLFERYFLIPFVFFLLLLSYVLGDLFRRGRSGRAVALAVLLAVLAGGVWHVSRFAEQGRGQFHEALAHVVQADERGPVVVTGDHDFRIAKFCHFYGPRAGNRTVVYQRGDELPAEGATWLLVHRLDDRHRPGEVERDARGNAYRLERAYPSAGLGCWGCFVYRREHNAPAR